MTTDSASQSAGEGSTARVAGRPAGGKAYAAPPPARDGAAGPRQRVPRKVREQVILDVAARTFADRGYHATTMDEIAEEVGVSKQLVYNYVGSKEQLYLACFRRAGRTLQDQLERAADSAEPPDMRLWRGILAFFAFVDEHREAWSILYGPGAARDGGFAAETTRQRASVAAQLARLFAASRAAEGGSGVERHGDRPAELPRGTDEVALALVGAGEVLATWWLDHPEVPREKVALRLMNFAWLGLGDLLHGHAWRPAAH